MKRIEKIRNDLSPLVHVREQRKRILEGVVWAICIVLLSVLLVYLMHLFQDYLKVNQATLQRFAIFVYIAVFIISVLNTATIVIPAPGLALVVAIATQWNPVIVAVVASIGSTIGELSGYYAGRVGQRIISIEHMKGYDFAKRRVQRHGYWIISFFALVPLVLFDVVGLVAGGLKIPVGKFLIASWVGRLPRSFIEIYAGASLLHLVFPQWFS